MGISYVLRDIQRAVHSARTIYNQTKLIRQITAVLIIWNTILTLWVMAITGVMIAQEYHRQHDDFVEIPIEALEVI